MVVVLQWYYNERDGRPGRAIMPELSAVFGPFLDKTAADTWVDGAEKWGGWGEYKYQVEKLHNVLNASVG
jgi:hypothetical protein